MKSFLTAGFVLATCAAFAALPEQTFDMTPGKIETEGNWYGGTVVEEETAGKVLAIDGTVSCSNAVNSTESEFVKTSFKVLAPADATATMDLPSDGLTDCQIAIATGDEVSSGSSNLKVMIYHGGTNSGWAETGLTVAKGAWFEVTLHFDYTAKKAKVQIGGAISEFFDLVTVPANEATASKINSLSFVGSSKIDNVSIDEAITKATLAAEGASALDGLEVYSSDLTAAGLETTAISNANVIKSITAGLTPTTSEVTFNATALSTDSTQTVITVPCDKDYGQVYQVVINDTTTVPATAGDIEGGARALTFTVPSELASTKVLKFQVKVGVLTPPSSSNS